ncbi:flagellar rod protein FlaI [Photobacterium sp. 1_MG-2023]|uniref:flagellar rod protein FlaI n=1 Tax=Photobacterium sp. 1_MG-2023 TaxID=3062646 RepID=UPI0026E42E1B|nr:flagellar rod protein FlaI [Photobacterium sp. 1_MG-2023]MDO6705199.1 flagellar rod protein FlaI [Photobacterium sp. 1_MG-2023]
MSVKMMQTLADIDQQLYQVLNEGTEIDADKLHALLADRQTVLNDLKAVPELLDKDSWQEAIDRTSDLLTILRERREMSADQLKRLQHGQRSVQAYHQFR